MEIKTFSECLDDYIVQSTLQKREIIAEVDRLYSPLVKITEPDLTRFLKGGAIPKLDKFAALVDVLGLSHAEIARLVRLSRPRA